jgi:O-antigen/teichoic acid export membrane protein
MVGIPTGTVAVGVGLVVLGAASYAFLGIGARALGARDFAELSVVWTVLFTLGPGLFLPLEQETAKRLAVRGTRSGAAHIMRRALAIAGGLVLLLTAGTVVLMLASSGRLLSGTAVWVAMMAANGALALVHCSRGWLAGGGRFVRYGVQLASDGCLRVIGAVLLAAMGVHTVAGYAWVLCGAQLLAVAMTLAPTPGRRSAPAGAVLDSDGAALTASANQPASQLPSTAVLGRSIGLMVAATLASQLIISAGPVAVKILAAPTDVGAGRFLTTLVVARVPLFLFSALQASLLPGLARMVSAGDRGGIVGTVRRLALLLATVGGALVLVLVAVGPGVTSIIFGPGYRAARSPLAVLALGCTVYMIASVVAQAVLALHSSGSVALGWWAGVVVFAAMLAIPTGLPLRVSVALLVGSGVAGLWFALSLRKLLQLRFAPPAAVSIAGTRG